MEVRDLLEVELYEIVIKTPDGCKEAERIRLKEMFERLRLTQVTDQMVGLCQELVREWNDRERTGLNLSQMKTKIIREFGGTNGKEKLFVLTQISKHFGLPKTKGAKKRPEKTMA